MNILRTLTYLLLLIILSSCQVERKAEDKNALKIFEKVIKDYQANYKDTPLVFSTEREFKKVCLGEYKGNLEKLRKSDSLCKEVLTKYKDSSSAVPCVLRSNYFKYNNILTNKDLEFFASDKVVATLLNSEIKAMLESDLLLDYDAENIEAKVYRLITGVYRNPSKQIAFVQWSDYNSNLSGITSQCALYVYKDNDWFKIGNLNYGYW